VWSAAAVTALADQDNHYREGAAELTLGSGFFRRESRPARDLSVLLAAQQARDRGDQQQLRWLDLMSGCGVRALRWGLEAAAGCRIPPWIHANDADPDRLAVLQANCEPLLERGLRPRLTDRAAEQLLAEQQLNGERFDLIDLDAFGSPGPLIQPALQRLRRGGILFLASTDGRSPTGHERVGAVRSLGAAARVHPASWELALRHQLGLIARLAWMNGHGISPLFSFSDGRTFRTAVRLQQNPDPGQDESLGLLARCEACGDQQEQSLLRLTGWPSCCCRSGQGRWMVSGPLWLGPLQDPAAIEGLMQQTVPVTEATTRLLKRLHADRGSPARVWPTAELSKRLALQGAPPLQNLVAALQGAGHQAVASGVMAGQLRTDAKFPELLQLCRHCCSDEI
jgi:tRNA (guanine26-N2/guanine27-N2)-dimethyltransferase